MQMYQTCLPPVPLYPPGNLTSINQTILVPRKVVQTSEDTRINVEVFPCIRDGVPDTALFALSDLDCVLVVIS